MISPEALIGFLVDGGYTEIHHISKLPENKIEIVLEGGEKA